MAEMRQLLGTSSMELLTLEEGAQVQGLLMLWNLEGMVFLENFAVSPSLRGQGMGAKMLEYVWDRWNKPMLLEVEPPEGQMQRRRIGFYEHNGFKMDYTEDLVRLNDPDEVPQLFNCSCITLPLNTVQEQMDLVSRMRGAGFSYFDHGFLLQQMNRQNFAALGILYGSNLVGACVAAGQYTSAEVMGLYIVPEFQRKGLGTRLLQQTKQALASTGVTDLTMRVMSDSEPQVRLVQRFRAELVEHTSVFPSMQI